MEGANEFFGLNAAVTIVGNGVQKRSARKFERPLKFNEAAISRKPCSNGNLSLIRQLLCADYYLLGSWIRSVRGNAQPFYYTRYIGPFLLFLLLMTPREWCLALHRAMWRRMVGEVVVFDSRFLDSRTRTRVGYKIIINKFSFQLINW